MTAQEDIKNMLESKSVICIVRNPTVNHVDMLQDEWTQTTASIQTGLFKKRKKWPFSHDHEPRRILDSNHEKNMEVNRTWQHQEPWHIAQSGNIRCKKGQKEGHTQRTEEGLCNFCGCSIVAANHDCPDCNHQHISCCDEEDMAWQHTAAPEIGRACIIFTEAQTKEKVVSFFRNFLL